MEKYINRLFEEWKLHGKIIISVDYDDTISAYRPDFNTEDIARTIKLVQLAYHTGAYIVVFTACSPDRYIDIQNHCEEIRLPINAINKNPIELPFGGKDGSKIYYNINLCDRSGLTQALDILDAAMYRYRGYQQTQSITDVV